jgi:uncharacterized small protein (DUF1192 family)
MKNQNLTSAKSSSNSAPTTSVAVDPKAELKAIREKAKALRAQVKAAVEATKAERKEASKEVTLRWINNFSQRITRLQAKIDRAAADRTKLISRAKENGWLQ